MKTIGAVWKIAIIFAIGAALIIAFSTGSSQSNWDWSNEAGEEVASGVYLIYDRSWRFHCYLQSGSGEINFCAKVKSDDGRQ